MMLSVKKFKKIIVGLIIFASLLMLNPKLSIFVFFDNLRILMQFICFRNFLKEKYDVSV